MSTPQNRIVRRRVGSAVVGLLGAFVLCNAILPVIDGFRRQSREFMEHLPILLIIAAFLLFLGSVLLYAALRLWRRPA